MTEGEFDGWLERSLARELRGTERPAPARDWARSRPQVRRRAAEGPGAGPALALKAATAFAVVVLAAGVTGGAISGSANPVAWGHAVEEATVSALPLRLEDPAPPTPSAQPNPGSQALAAASGARHEAGEDGHAGRSDDHRADGSHHDKATAPAHDDHDSGAHPGVSPAPRDSPADNESHS